MERRALVIVLTRGIDDERSSVAFTLARGAQRNGLQVAVFLTSTGVDVARRGGIELTHVPPLSPLATLVAEFLADGGILWSCPPCTKSRGYTAESLVPGAEILGVRPDDGAAGRRRSHALLLTRLVGWADGAALA